MVAPDQTHTPIEIEYLNEDSAARFGRWRNILVVHGVGSPTVDNIGMYKQHMTRLLREYPAGIGVLTVIGDRTTPHPDARDALISTFTSMRDRVHATFVLKSGGFAIAAQRAIITAILLATGLRKRINISSALGDAVDWMHQRIEDNVKQDVSPGALYRATERFCARTPAASVSQGRSLTA